MKNKYQRIRDKIKTGDLIAFSGKSLVANTIKSFTDSDISHVGIVYRADGGRVQLMESTSLSNQKDIKHNDYIKGVQLHYLSERIEKYNGEVYLKRILKPIPNEKEMLEWLSVKHSKRTPYDYLQAFGAGVDTFDFIGLRNEPDFSSLFCSEMVAKALQVGGVISEQVNPSEETPADVMDYLCFSMIKNPLK
jgi:hypothetical protein